MGAILDALRSVDFLAGSPRAVLTRFLAAGRPVRRGRGFEFWRRGQDPQGIVVPVNGWLAAVGSGSGGRELWHAFVGPGDCAGVPCALDGLPHSEKLRVLRGGEFVEMERACFLSFLAEHPSEHALALGAARHEYRNASQQCEEIAFHTVRQRLLRYLLDRTCARAADGARILIDWTHAEVASHIGSVREVVARVWADLGARGILRRTRHGLFVADRARLLEEAARDEGWADDPLRHQEATERAQRFFLPILARGVDEARRAIGPCVANNQDMAPCLECLCPPAVACGLGGGTTPGRTVAGTSRPAQCADPRPPRTPTLTPAPRPAPPRELEPCRPVQHLERSHGEQRAMVKTVERYRQRVERIEAMYDDETRIPAACSIFDEQWAPGAGACACRWTETAGAGSR